MQGAYALCGHYGGSLSRRNVPGSPWAAAAAFTPGAQLRAIHPARNAGACSPGNRPLPLATAGYVFSLERGAAPSPQAGAGARSARAEARQPGFRQPGRRAGRADRTPKARPSSMHDPKDRLMSWAWNGYKTPEEGPDSWSSLTARGATSKTGPAKLRPGLSVYGGDPRAGQSGRPVAGYNNRA